MLRSLISKRSTTALVTLFAAALAGCGGGTTSENGPPPVPTVTHTTPANGATGIAINNNFAVTFTETMDRKTLNSTTFTLTGPGTTPIVGNVSALGNTSVFRPDALLPANTEFTATITTGAKSAAGQALAAPYSWTMTSGAAPDTTKPTVASTVPSSGATGVALSSSLVATFSEAIDTASLTATSFTLARGSTAVAGAVTSTGVTSTFVPTVALSASTAYTATITTAAKDLAGNTLASNYTWTFTTGAAPDTTQPAVSSTVPSSGAAAVATNAAITVLFSEPMAAATLTTTTFKLTSPGPVNVAGAVSYTGLTATFQPTAALAASTVFTATITVGATDLAGNALASAYVWTFTTGTGADTTAPVVSSTTPANNATAVATNSAVSAVFSEAMAPATLSTTTFKVTSPGPVAVAGTVVFAGTTATFQPTSALAASTVFTATITTGATDLAGNALSASKVWTFTTGATADTTAPTVSSTIPAANATGVAPNAALSATFSEAMAPATITSVSFTVTSPGPVSVAGAVTYTGTTATFQATSALASNTVFTATITTAAKDLAGNALAAAKVWTFTTGTAADTTAPTVSSTLPLGSATGVLETANVKATFSEAMAPLTLTATTFTVTGPGVSAFPGAVTYDAPSKTATFDPTDVFVPNTIYTGHIKSGASGVTDLAGNQLASDYSWTFTTGAHVGLGPVLLGASGNYVVLAKTAVSTVPTSAITGDIGLSPAAASFITGFGLTAATGYATSPQVVGQVFAADYAPPTPSNLTTAVSNMEAAYTDAAGRPPPNTLDLATGAIGGQNLAPGLYKWNSTVSIGSDLTFTGNANDVWILQISGDLSVASAKHVFLNGGALAKNIFWQVAGAVSIGTTAHFEGIVLSQTGITLNTGASINGRLLAQSAVALDSNAVTQPAP